MTAAAELISELGWGRVTTRAVAARAGLPHGTVSYHFRGKQDLLASAAMWTFTQVLPIESFESADSLEALLSLVGAPDATGSALSRLMLETMREAERDPALGAQMRSMLAAYRQVFMDVVRAEQERGAVARDISVEGLATLIAAVGDGLAVHALLDPDLDMVAPLDALRALLGLPRHGRG